MRPPPQIDSPADVASSPAASAPVEMRGEVLRCGPRSVSDGSGTQARIAHDVAEQATRRIGTLAILTAVTVVGVAVLQSVLQPEMAAAHQTPLYRLSGLFLVLAAIGLAALERTGRVGPQTLLDLGLIFETGGALALALMENSMPWQNSTVRGSTAVGPWIAICVMVIPNRPWKSIAAAAVSACMVPCGHLLAAQILHYPALPWNRLAVYSLSAVYAAVWTPFVSTHIHRMREDLSRTQEFGSYHLERLLGQGGMGEVWLARHRFLRREAAVKLVLGGLLERAGAAGRREIQQRFELEARAIASLRSPHTVAIYDYGLAENGQLYYAMEFLLGLDAENLVKKFGPQPAGRVISFLRQACESLEEAHDSGLVHRDVKPSNLFICRLGRRGDFVKMLDFGLVKTVAGPAQSDLTTLSGASGTPAFMAPEQARGEEVDARTDVYGLGCVAYFLLTGTTVFQKPNAMAMALAHLTERPEPPSARSELPIAESLQRTVMACLEKNREDRPQTVGELQGMLDACTDVTPWTVADANRWWALHWPELGARAS